MLLGETILIKGTSFKIIGIFEPKGSVGFRNTDEYAWVPLNTALARMHYAVEKLRPLLSQDYENRGPGGSRP